MRYVTVRILFLLLLGATSCRDKVAPDERVATNTLQANEWIDGKWGLVSISGGYVSFKPGPKPPAPKPKESGLQLIINNGRMMVLDKGKPTIHVNFEITPTSYGLRFKTKARPEVGRWYLLDSDLKLSRNELFLDTGISHDSPGYAFERIE